MGEKKKKIRAAGGVVYRTRDDGAVEIALVHRPRYRDWTLPKGKLEWGETDEEGALREVHEETGLRCVVERPLGTVRYKDRSNRPKEVVYFLMRVLGGKFYRNFEVDKLRWVTPEEAVQILDYPHDRELIAGFAATPPV